MRDERNEAIRMAALQAASRLPVPARLSYEDYPDYIMKRAERFQSWIQGEYQPKDPEVPPFRLRTAP